MSNKHEDTKTNISMTKNRPQTANSKEYAKSKPGNNMLQDITNTMKNKEESVQNTYKEIATKVVDLQRQVMSLRGKLK